MNKISPLNKIMYESELYNQANFCVANLFCGKKYWLCKITFYWFFRPSQVPVHGYGVGYGQGGVKNYNYRYPPHPGVAYYTPG